ncbi:MAG: 1-acyl-sn-glycerol-3-phosphate acyltransferase [Rhodocyclales bacterium GT-UBC]|nr:MAG: 1-acyl-sn-glycerol-3-phosphate acyltransferase [Rhodocyclales bacterium GT-UBC]
MLPDRLIAASICSFAKLFTGVRARWIGGFPDQQQRIYFANHRSHGDFVLIWASLPARLRRLTRPVAGADYWLQGGLRRFLINRVFRAVLIDRLGGRRADPIAKMGDALDAGESLILFPEGTRNLGDGLLPFKSGLYHLACSHPEIELVPVWIENLGRAMPKGSLIPLPLLCSLTFGRPLTIGPAESKADFLARARQSLLDLAPPAD